MEGSDEGGLGRGGWGMIPGGLFIVVFICVYDMQRCIYELEECMANLQLDLFTDLGNFLLSKDAPDEKGDNPIRISSSRRSKTADKAAFDNKMLKVLYPTFLSDIQSISLPSPTLYDVLSKDTLVHQLAWLLP